MNRQRKAKVITTDGLRSCKAAIKVLDSTTRYFESSPEVIGTAR